MKMKELAEATGLPKSTIIHYLNQKLLPEPVKTGPNMAYYHPSSVERIAFIKEVQARHRFPLGTIRKLLTQWEKGRDLEPLLELQTYIFGSGTPHGLSRKAFCRATGLTGEELEEFLAADVLIPREDGRFDQVDVVIGSLIRASLDIHMVVDDFKFYPRLAEQIVSEELAIRDRFTKDLPFEQDAALTLEFTRSARALRSYVIDRLFQRRILEMKGLKKQKRLMEEDWNESHGH